MNDNFFEILFSQITGQVPNMLIYLVGMIIAILFLRSYPLPSTLTLLGCFVTLLVALVHSVMFAIILSQRSDGTWTPDTTGQTLGFIGLVANIFRALGIGLVILAVFVGRTRVRKADLD